MRAHTTALLPSEETSGYAKIIVDYACDTVGGHRPPSVRADSVYAITFFDGEGPAHPTVVGSNLLDFDSISQSFTTPSLTVMYEGETIILENVGLSGANPNYDYNWYADAHRGTITIGYVPCLISGNLEPCNIYIGPLNFNPNFRPFDVGQVTFSFITPEPSSVALMLLGLGLVFVMRKRTGQGLSRTS